MKKTESNGFSLIEVMVSILILGIGVIGAAALQLHAMRTTQQSGLHTTALELASEMADLMRANDKSMRRLDAENGYVGASFNSLIQGEPQAPGQACYSHACDDVSLADFNLYEWTKRIAESLPGGRAVICRDRTPWDSAAGSLTWTCEGNDDADASLVIKIGWIGKNPNGTLVESAGGDFPPAIALHVSPYVP